jgi:transglutaminase-like putative cysteine protease
VPVSHCVNHLPTIDQHNPNDTTAEGRLKIRFGFEMAYSCGAPTPMVLALTAAPARSQRLLRRDVIRTTPKVPVTRFADDFGNICTRFTAPAGIIRIRADGLLKDSGRPEVADWDADETPISKLPPQALMYMLPSRYVESDSLAPEALRLFGGYRPGWTRVQAICDFVHQHVTFGYEHARPTKTAVETYREKQGVCRDFAHLAIAFCRALSIPARYATTYLGEIGVPPTDAPMDFAACMEVFLAGKWHVFDPRNNTRRVGRLIIARGRDAADVAISNAFGPVQLEHFEVWTEEVRDAARLGPRMKGLLAASLVLGALGVGLAWGQERLRSTRL